MDRTFYPKQNSLASNIPDSLPNYSQPVFTPKNQEKSSKFHEQFMRDVQQATEEFFDEPDYVADVAKGINDILSERPQLSRSEAEEQMHLTELRRLAEAYTENDAVVISEVLARRYPFAMFTALNNEFADMKYRLETITGAVNDGTQP